MPLRVRLTLSFAVGLSAVLAGLGVFVYSSVGRDLMAAVDLGLRGRVQALTGQIEARGSGPIVSAGPLIDADEAFAQVVDANGRLIQANAALSSSPLLPPTAFASIEEPTFFVRTIPDADPIRVLVVPMTRSGEKVFLVAGATLGDRRDALHRVVVAFALGGPVVLVLMSGACWLIVGAALRPVERMRQEADAVSATEPQRRLPVPGTGDELARLGTTLNSMLDRLQQALERERRFVDDASHELRTPLSVLKMELDLALARGRSPEELEAAIRNASEETDRLVRLAEDLLVLARTEKDRMPLERRDVSMPELVEEIVRAHAKRGQRAGVRIDVEVEPVKLPLDPIRVRQAVENLLDNALRLTGRGGVIVLRTKRIGDAVQISVDDSGPGFPPDLLDRAFEPFTSAATGVENNGSRTGAGLGLAIVRAVAEAHGGTAAAENLPGGGARVTFLLRT
jgi:signal transduction histidine kinase